MCYLSKTFTDMLGEKGAAALFDSLAISGRLRWGGTAAEFAHFIWTLSEAKGDGLIEVRKICLAFGFSDKERQNIIIPLLTKTRK